MNDNKQLPKTKKDDKLSTKVPRILQADAYTVGSGPHISNDAKQASVYQVVLRRGLTKYLSFAQDERLVVHGLRRIIQDLFSEPVTTGEVDEAESFLKTFHAGGVAFNWDRSIWDRLITEYSGRIPIRIEAVADGQVVFPGEPIMQVTAVDGYGELAAYFESKLLQVWAPSERVTSLRWWWEYLRQECKRLHPSWDSARIDFTTSIMCHDFGDRAGSCSMESEVLGMAHLMVLPGTDTTAGAFLDWKNTGKPYGCSIHALAHRTVMSYMKEQDAHIALYNLGKKTGITAHVSDTYDFEAVVDKFANKLANDPNWKQDSNLTVLRPDSGSPIDCVLHICRTAEKYGLYTVDPDSGLKMATRLKWIEGDSMHWDLTNEASMQEIMVEVERAGFSPFGFGAFGVGGSLRNSISRDHTGLSMKLAAVGADLRPVCKRSDTPAKSSIPGPVLLLDNGAADKTTVYSAANTYLTERRNLLLPWYDGKLEQAFLAPALETNEVVRARVQGDFLKRRQPSQVLSQELADLRQAIWTEQMNAIKENW